MCTYCGQHCVEDEFYRLSKEELKSGKKRPENTCPDKQDWSVPNDDKSLNKDVKKYLRT
tara:strand:+ start:369 stop:545 length:177 start_codon:yes stop_codon:yes gene_type:complete